MKGERKKEKKGSKRKHAFEIMKFLEESRVIRR